MPNMFGSGPLKMTLEQLANEVWEEDYVLLSSCRRGTKVWQEGLFRVMKWAQCWPVFCPFHLFPAND
jgi:hypothetical protein